MKDTESSVKNNSSLEENTENQMSNIDSRSNTGLGLNVLEDPSLLQTEHLLQMASSVVNALEDNNESTESESLSNLIEKNEFLNISLEEHKKLVNQLHSQVSRQVSIHKFSKIFFKFLILKPATPLVTF